MQSIEFILYVADQERSKQYYTQLLQKEPQLHVPGMTEFECMPGVKLGLMPESGIVKILGDRIEHPKKAQGVPRCELYLKVGEAKQYIERGIQLGGKLISPLQDRDWGDRVGYIADPDGHIIAFAE